MVMLQAVLPQVAEHSDIVELWISDNASTDDTPGMIEAAKALGPFQYSRNRSNLGAVQNILRLTTELARGEWVWALGDDDLLMPGALSRVVAQLQASPELDAVYFNFRCADYQRDWPTEAVGGFDGSFDYLGNTELTDRYVSQWQELIRPENVLCTQLYGHVIRRSVWINYWCGRELREMFADVRHTYPHTCMLAETIMHKPSCYVAEPVLTIFNNGQSWTDEQPVIVLLRYPELLGLYGKLDLPAKQLSACATAVFSSVEPFLVKILQKEAGPRSPTLGQYLRANWRFREAWTAIGRASVVAGRPWPLTQLCRASLKAGQLFSRARGKLQLEGTRLRGALDRLR
jgi:hypothetical protein